MNTDVDGNSVYFHTKHITDEMVRHMLMDAVSKLQANYQIDMNTDLGFGYTLEYTIKHMQDETKLGKQLIEAYRLALEEHYTNKYLGESILKP